ncbi:VENN motif pre-toxin domain-containing protein [Neisseria weaveri]|uniref:VENN motif pre-toxin domain-containing protein n=1 Tax=Neisseria weaveri TaxID=28091 RepID=UPI000D31018E|nr:VENN motif pre-toxin domain-containing protein [Neisseria weaveri]
MQKELDIQREVTQQFGSNIGYVKSQVNRRIEGLKAAREAGRISQEEYDKKVQSLQYLNIGLSSASAALSASTDSALGLAASAANPVVSYHIGQHFKQNDELNQLDGGKRPGEGSKEHIALHTLNGLLTGAANGSHAVVSGLSAGGAELLAPTLAQSLYGKSPKELTAEEKANIGSLAGVFGAAVGAASGDVAGAVVGSQVAQSAVENNNSAIRTLPNRHLQRQQRIELTADAVDELFALLMGNVGDIKRGWAQLSYETKYEKLIESQQQLERLGYRVPLVAFLDRNGNQRVDLEASKKNISYALSRLSNASQSEKAAFKEAKRSGHILKNDKPLAVRAVTYRDPARNMSRTQAMEYLYQNTKGEYVVLQRHHLGHMYLVDMHGKIIDTKSSQPAHWNVRHYPEKVKVDPNIWASIIESDLISNFPDRSKYGEAINYPKDRNIPDHIPYSTQPKKIK